MSEFPFFPSEGNVCLAFVDFLLRLGSLLDEIVYKPSNGSLFSFAEFITETQNVIQIYSVKT